MVTNRPASQVSLPERHPLVATSQFILGMIGVIAAVMVLVPWMPHFPTSGLDPSWRHALNEALAQGAIFGRDVVFTFGPLASVYTQNYHPATDAIMVLGSLVHALGLSAAFVLAAGPRRGSLLLGLPIVIALGIHRDAGFIVLPFLLLFGVVRCTLPPDSPGYTRLSVPMVGCIILATVALALAPLVKGSFAATSGLVAGLIAITLVRHRLGLALGFCALCVATVVCTWMLLGQPLLDLPHFFIAQAPVISGYTTAMSLHGSSRPVVVYWVACAVLMAVFHFGMIRHWGWRGYIVLLALAFTLFVGFKAGFVRQDGHMFMAGELLLFVGMLALLVLRMRYAVIVGLVCGLAWATIGNAVMSVGVPFIKDRLAQTWRVTADGVQTRLHQPQTLPARYEASLAAIRQQVPLPPITGKADIYPVELSGLLAWGGQWAGRPVFQSYSVYSPELNVLNNDHLNSDSAPDTVLFSFQPIDGRLPALDDSLSLRTLLSRYTAKEVAGSWLVMTRNGRAQSDLVTPGKTQSLQASFGTVIELPRRIPVWMTVDIRPTMLGKLASTLYKLPRLWIVLTLDDGEVIRHRYIPGIGQSGFIVSPYLSQLADLNAFQHNAKDQRYVRSVEIESSSALLWGKQFQVQVTPLKVRATDAPTSSPIP